MLIPLTVGAIFAPIQIGVGDWIANTVAELQPAKLAAMEAQYETGAQAPLSLGGIYYDNELHYALEVPYGLSLLIHHDPNGVVPGLEEIPVQNRPPVNVVHLAYNAMVGAGSALLLLAMVYGFAWWKRRSWLENPWFLRAVALSGIAGGRGAGDGLDHHGGRAPAVERLRLPAHGRCREPGAGALPRLLRGASRSTWRSPSRRCGAAPPGHRPRHPRAVRGRRRGALDEDRVGRDDAREVLLGVMFVGLIAYALFGGADFGAGIWDLLAGGTRRGRGSVT
jgi:diadenosine tetraphosphatase ApaH/serine/threonine PP2A family protein phosphatase